MDETIEDAGLTKLAQDLYKLAELLMQHSEARKFLNKCTYEDGLINSIQFVPEKTGNPFVTIFTQELPAEVYEALIIHALEHESKMALDIWRRIDFILQKANIIISALEAQADD